MPNIKEQQTPPESWETRFDKVAYFLKGRPGYKIIKDFIIQEKQKWVEEIEKLKIKPIYGDFEMKTIKEGEKKIYCLTCGAFLLESVCQCIVKNDLIEEIIKKLTCVNNSKS